MKLPFNQYRASFPFAVNQEPSGLWHAWAVHRDDDGPSTNSSGFGTTPGEAIEECATNFKRACARRVEVEKLLKAAK